MQITAQIVTLYIAKSFLDKSVISKFYILLTVNLVTSSC